MGRGGRGRGRGGGKRFGRGSSGGGGSRGRRGGFPSVSRKDAAHISQFGEKHPSQEMERDFGFGASSAKKGKFDRGGRGRGFSRGFQENDRNRRQFPSDNANDISDTSSEEDNEEEEKTPYNELLSVFTGKKQEKIVQIVSSDEESGDEDEGESSNDRDNDSDINTSANEEELQETIDDSDSDSNDSLQEEEVGGDDDSDGDTRIEVSDSKKDQDLEVDNENVDEVAEEDTVIEDAELDPENEEAFNGSQVDPFIQHFEREMSEGLQKELKKDKPNKKVLNLEWPTIEKFTFVGPNLQHIDYLSEERIEKDSVTDLSELDKLPEVKLPEPPFQPQKQPSLATLYIKSQLHSTLPIVNQGNIDKEGSARQSRPLSELQTEFIDLASRYHDMYFPLRTINNAEEIRLAYCLHVANHVLKTRTRILHHNAKMANKTEVPAAYRDQGFVRPKVLILAPFKDSAFRIVQLLISLILVEEKGNVANKKRFMDEYGGQTLFMPKTNPKPEDYVATFNGNVEDNFKIGLAVTKKSIKLYTGFYSSDIIIASPLGLRMIIGAEGEKDRDYDFLSSIEVFIMDQADVFLMQNWDHLLHIMRHLHLQPVTTHGTDFARIRPWALDGLSKYYCQTLVFSSVACPEHSSLLTKYGANFAGQARVIQNNLKGSICHVTVQLPQVFQKFDVSSIQEADEARFKYFIKHVLPNFKEKLMSHTLIFVASYFDFVRLRNYFRREDVSFVQISEYAKDKKIARARDLFFHGSNHFLLYTERSHFFRRFRLKGLGHIIFYQLPQNPQFYPELCNFIQESFQNRRVRQRQNSSVNVLYCKYDTPRLAAIVGNERAGHMLNSEKNTHAFVSGADL